MSQTVKKSGAWDFKAYISIPDLGTLSRSLFLKFQSYFNLKFILFIAGLPLVQKYVYMWSLLD